LKQELERKSSCHLFACVDDIPVRDGALQTKQKWPDPKDTGHRCFWRMTLPFDGKVLLATFVMLPGHRELAYCCKTAEMTMRRKKATPLDWRKYIDVACKVKLIAAQWQAALHSPSRPAGSFVQAISLSIATTVDRPAPSRFAWCQRHTAGRPCDRRIRSRRPGDP